MAFKAQKLNIDLELDLTEYILENEGGILKTDKTKAEDINEWLDMAIQEGEKLTKLNKDYEAENMSIVDINKESQKSIIKQIDYFYSKGEKFYKKIPVSILNDMLKYINGQISPVKKK